jgi:hypothetical protein
MYAFAPEKPPSLVGRNFCLAIVRVFAKASKIGRGGVNPVNDKAKVKLSGGLSPFGEKRQNLGGYDGPGVEPIVSDDLAINSP